MERREEDSISAPPHTEACFCFGLGLVCEELKLMTGVRHNWDLNTGFYGCELSALPLSHPTVTVKMLFFLFKTNDHFWSPRWPEGRRSCIASFSSCPFTELVTTWRHLLSKCARTCVRVIGQWKIPWNCPPQLGIEPGPWRGQSEID